MENLHDRYNCLLQEVTRFKEHLKDLEFGCIDSIYVTVTEGTESLSISLSEIRSIVDLYKEQQKGA